MSKAQKKLLKVSMTDITINNNLRGNHHKKIGLPERFRNQTINCKNNTTIYCGQLTEKIQNLRLYFIKFHKNDY